MNRIERLLLVRRIGGYMMRGRTGMRQPRLDLKSIEKSLRTLTRYNRWRRGRDGVIDNPSDIWLAIDVAIRLLRLARYDSQSYGDER